MKLGKIFICINILVFSLLMLTGCTEKWPRIIYQNTSYRFDEFNSEFDLEAEEFSVYRNGEVYIERQISSKMLRIEGTYPYHIRKP